MYQRLIFSAIAFMFVTSIVFASPKGVEFTVNPLTERVVERLIVRGVLQEINFNTRPLDRETLIEAIHKAKREIKSGRLHLSMLDLKLLELLEEELKYEPVSVTLNGRTARNEMIDEAKAGIDGVLSVDWRVNERLELYKLLLVDRFGDRYPKAGESASFRLQTWKLDYTADFQEAYAKLESKRLKVLVGRHSVFWSPAKFGALGISDNSPSFDMIMLATDFTSQRWGSFYGYALSSVLDKMWNNKHERYLANRYLSAHRLDWLLSGWAEIGLTEIILYGGDVRLPEPGYLNPIMPYYATQYNPKHDDNVLFLADISLRPADGFRIYGEILIDDFQYAYSDDPNDMGFTLGFNLAKSFDLSAEYTRVSRWAYTHLATENQFLHYGSVIGHPIGPDGDVLTVETSKFLNKNLLLALRYRLKRKGEATPEDRYRGEDSAHIGFPSGMVERTDEFTFEAVYYPIKEFWARLSFSMARVKNESHEPGLSCWKNWFDLRIGLELTIDD